ncbi:transmembrane protein 165-like [Bradysia coprophila]|uniref:transmembrane protein 165-like n=1 Tax=Bradysia coprophila TaxID=38358 RepID=UPI00187D703D|nr:transmembrane protein 165-like [Bradysia coprophila]
MTKSATIMVDILNKYLPTNMLVPTKHQTIFICLMLLCQSSIVLCDDSYEAARMVDYPNTTVEQNVSIATDPTPTESQSFFSNLLNNGFVHAFVASLSVILVSELGDKTFFIAAIMAMQHSRIIVFLGAISALALMTILSAVFGLAAQFIPHIYTFYISTALFVFFGLKMLWDGYHMTAKDSKNELEEVQSDIRRREIELQSTTISPDAESATSGKQSRFLTWKVILQAFTMTFLAEWGDRSQLTTIVLAAREDIYGIMVGGCLGHAICTGAAVIGGRLVAQKISVKHVTLIGGVVFLIFAVVSLIMGPNDEKPEDVAP